ncbi:MAG: hypothetical protein WCI20_00400 [bacterium]
MRSLPTKDQIDCLTAEGIDAKRLPMAGPSSAQKPSLVKVTTVKSDTAPVKINITPEKGSSNPPPVYTPPAPLARGMPDIPVPLAILLLVIVLIMIVMGN